MSDLEHNKQVVIDYYQTAFNGNPEKAIADHFGPAISSTTPRPRTGPRRSPASSTGCAGSTRT
jgi:hypothetical protein